MLSIFSYRHRNNPYVVKANDQISVSADEQTLKALKDINFVREVWTE